ncbi:MAG: glycoside hydrolase family 127 protein [Lentisphaeria bacterium]|nr:glycoside hydrolase family 127 protein [Lentisphaeria bacterium]
MQLKNYNSIHMTKVTPNDGIFKKRIKTCYSATIPSSLQKCYETGRIDAFKLDWQEGMPNKPHIFWDSDVAKVLEGIANILALYPDKELEKEYDKIIDLIASAQQKDGYLNSFFSSVSSDRWQGLYMNHELYCAGHLFEAAVAGYELLGKKKLLEVACRYADYIESYFGRKEGQVRGIPGHEEIELALIRLYKATGEKRYFDLAKYFIDERGTSPNYFAEVEGKNFTQIERFQAHKPVREQTEAVGHSVRAVYLYCGMADVARLSDDDELFHACETLFENITRKRMYITGGIGSSFSGEIFTTDYDLSNGSLMYAESCAAIGLARFASRMFNATGDGRYAEIVEKTIFNGILSGISLSGDKFFYTNYLEVDDNTYSYNHGAKERQPWFDCSCCPTNFCRFLPEMLSYIWSESDSEITLNLPIANSCQSTFGELEVISRYPYDGKITVKVKSNKKFTLKLRIPEWCKKYEMSLNGVAVTEKAEKTYIAINRTWSETDVVEYNLDMPVRVIHSNLKITGNTGRIALMRGPLVYACETIDNPKGIANMIIKKDQDFELCEVAGLPAETVGIKGKAVAESSPDNEALYFEGDLMRENIEFIAIPYALWNNRGAANMAVWIRCE